jgi:hypothetical protein
VSARRRLVPIGIDDPAWRGLTEADLWPGKPCREEREAAEIERLATTEEMLEAALGYAGLGWRIHPIRPREKLPILDEWQKRATTDARLIKRWFARTPDANVAVATGSGSGIMVIDVDGGDGETSLARLERQHGALPDFAPQQTTGNGWQIFLGWPEGREIRNSAARLGQKLDVRGEGGYVVLPPSIHPNGKRYRWPEGCSPWEILTDPPPGWLLDLLDPPAPPAPARERFQPAYRPAAGPDRYSLKALEAELALVAMAPAGGRNDQVWSGAKSLFRLVRDGRLSADIVARGLLDAARHAGCGSDPLCREKCRRGCRAEDAINRAAQKRGVVLR